MEITRLSPDDEVGCADAVELMRATAKLDCPEALLPTPRGYAAHLKHGWDGDPGQAFLARDEDGVAVGLLGLHTPTYDNTHLAWVDAGVHPDYRGRGIGSTLIAYGEELARELGRTSLGTDNWDLPKANAFSLRHGFEQKAIEVNRRQDIAGLDWSVVDRLYDEAAQEAHDRKIYRVIARERSTGDLAGHSTIVVERERPHIAEQHDTAVDRAHRGHRLGALVKTAMLLWMRDAEPAVTLLDTWNAESNAHMIAINEQLNYRIIARAIAYQKSL